MAISTVGPMDEASSIPLPQRPLNAERSSRGAAGGAAPRAMSHLLAAAGLVADEGHGGAVTLVQRFGSAAILDIHLHRLVLNGVCRRHGRCAPSFVETGAPTGEEAGT